jgi:tetratricopeptide (TPR) repeat protein
MSKKKRSFSLKSWLRKRNAAPLKASSLNRWLRLQPPRAWIAKMLNGFFEFRAPAWSKTFTALTFVPESDLAWYQYLNPFFHLKWSFGFAYRWIVSRPYLSFGPAFFAVVVTLFILGISVRERFERNDWRGASYRQQLASALGRQDYATAQICLTNLTHRYPDRDTYLFQQAIVDDKLENTELAISKMLRLVYSKNNPEAALFVIAKKFDVAETAKWSEEEHRQFRELAEIALKSNDENSARSTRLQLAKYYLSRGAYTDAASNFAATAGGNPTLLITTAQLYQRIGDEANATKYAEIARKILEEQVLASPSDKKARLELAVVLVILHREADAARGLSDAFRITEDKDYLTAGSESLVAWALRVRRDEGDTKESWIKQMNLLQQAMQMSPNSDAALEYMLEITVRIANNEDEEIQNLRAALLEGFSPQSLHFVEGTVALFNKDFEQANLHLNLAAKDNQQFPGILNNLAVAMMNQEGADLDRALALIDEALKRISPNEPYMPYFRETRGQVLVRLKRYEEAIPELEFSLRAPELAGPVHRSLAEAYRSLGQEEMAVQHEQLVEARKP